MQVEAHYRSQFLQRFLGIDENARKSVLDVGCGEGDFLLNLPASVTNRTGIEPDQSRAQRARERGLEVIDADATKLPFDDNSFDVVVSQYTAHHLVNAVTATREALRVARHGVLILDVWYDPEIPAGVTMRRFDRWSKQIDQDNGEVHFPVRSFHDITDNAFDSAMMPLSVEYWQIVKLLDHQEIEDAAAMQLQRSKSFYRDTQEWQEIREQAKQSGYLDEGAIFISLTKERGE